MAGASLLTLLDDIASVLDDIAVLSKVAAKKTAGVLGDDLALNAQQVSGVASEREIPVVWAVAKGSFRNKLILVPAALLISAIAPWLITPLLLVGGLYLSYEGAEKVIEKFFHKKQKSEDSAPVSSDVGSLEEYEKQKINGAIRTDFILSAEIIVIALGTVQGQPILTQILVVSTIAVLMTIGVYGLVAGIVKIDDLGFYMQKRKRSPVLVSVGNGLVAGAPKLMHLLTIIGTAAMFLVGGGIVVHSIPVIHHLIEPVLFNLPHISIVESLVPIVFNGLVGLLSGVILVGIVSIAGKIKLKKS